MTQASDIFVCTNQPNGSYTLNASPNIFCFGDASNGGWNYMLPATAIIYIIFGLGALVFFIYVYIYKKRLQYMQSQIEQRRTRINDAIENLKKRNGTVGDIEMEELMEDETISTEYMSLQKYEKGVQNLEKNFSERYKFLLKRFKRRHFYWEAVITGRKLILSLLYTFLHPIQVVVFGILVVFVALILHFRAVPFKQKFHNLMEYIVLLSTLLVLFMGFLFFVDLWPASWLETFSIVLTLIIIISCTIVIVLMVLADLWTRRRKDQQKQLMLKKELETIIGKNTEFDLKKQYKSLFPSALKNMNKIVVDEEDDPHDPWMILFNLLHEGSNHFKEEQEDFVNDDENDVWVTSTNSLRAFDDAEDEWVVMANVLAVDDNGDNVYASMSTRIVRVEFDLPFYMTDKEDSEEDNSKDINDVINSLFTIERVKKRAGAIRKSVKKLLTRSNTEESQDLI
jgi:protein-S-isoprenylcysteine O-methyltransferase Ste14